MKKIVRLTESDLNKIIKNIIREGAEVDVLETLRLNLMNEIPYYKNKPDSIRIDEKASMGGKLYFDGEGQVGMTRLATLPDNNDMNGPFWVAVENEVYMIGGGNMRSPREFKTSNEVINQIKNYYTPEPQTKTNENYNLIKMTESDLNRLVRRVIKEGVEIEMVTADYNDVSKNMRPGTQTSATLYFSKDNSIMLRVGSANLLLFGAPAQSQPNQK